MRHSATTKLPLALGWALVMALTPAIADAGGVTVSREIAYAKGATVREKVRSECGLQTVIPAAIAKNGVDVELVDGRGNLDIEITNAHGPGGGAFSGPKWVEVQGTLRRGGKAVSFRAKRFSAMDIFSGGTCGILAKCGRAIGKDIAVWLTNPTPDAELGDAR
jgi:hypothetical protein